MLGVSALGPEARAWLVADGTVELDAIEAALARLVATPDALPRALADDTTAALAALAALRDPGTAAHAAVAPRLGLLGALAEPAPPAVEHAPPPAVAVARPLLDHVTHALAGLARLERGVALDPAMTAAITAAAVDEVATLGQVGALPAVRVALLHLAVAKGGDVATRRAWAAAGVNLDVHNLGAEDLLADDATLAGYALDDAARALVRALVANHGLAGQHLRGETPASAFAPLRAALPSLPPYAAAALHVINLCDTAAVRPGLVDDALATELTALRDRLVEALPATRPLAERLRRLRAGRQRAGEPARAVDDAVAALAPATAATLTARLADAQLWYCEAATASLSPAAQLKVLAAAAGAATRAGVAVGEPWHAQLGALVPRLFGDGARVRYRVRVVEAQLAAVSVDELLGGAAPPGPLGAFAATLGRDRCVVLDWQPSDEADALVTLLSIYETKSSAAFHATLKALCDLYGLRKDEFDRVANEADYLATMNAARSDKERMLDHCQPGRVVEVGPGGGVVLDLLEARLPDSDVLGVDVSTEVIAALEARRAREGRRWRVHHADAFALPELCPPGTVDTVIFCSILHEIYSYVAYPGDDGSPPRRFRTEAVRDLLRAAFTTLRVGGRLVIRDGVAPPPGVRRLTLLADDARPMLELFAAQFEGRAIRWTELADGRIEMSTPDAMEFLYTYTWGPASFPYEVREQYGVMAYDAYVEAIVGWLGGPDTAVAVALPPGERSYLQPGYRDGLAGKVELTDEHDRPTPLPDSNCLIVVERRT
ncbi:MAG: methyltransferase [Kofleriaceae bacterium]